MAEQGKPKIIRGRATAEFVVPPPIVRISLGWGYYVDLPLEEARDLSTQLIEALRKEVK